MTVVLSFIVQYYYYLTFVFVCLFQPFDAFVTSLLKSCNTANISCSVGIYSCRPIIVAGCFFSLEKEPCGNKCRKYLLALALCDSVSKNLLSYYICSLLLTPNDWLSLRTAFRTHWCQNCSFLTTGHGAINVSTSMNTGLQDTYAYTFRTQLIITLKLTW